MTTSANNIVVGFSMSGASLPAGEGILVSLTFEESELGSSISLSDVIIGGYPDGTSIYSSDFDAADVPGCDDADCNGLCGGLAENDDCGVCDGDNTSCADCAGVPNGDASLDDCGDCSSPADFNSGQDDCGVCYGENADDLGCGCFEAGPSGCCLLYTSPRPRD